MASDPLELLEEPTLARVAERLVAEAQATAGAPAALYVGDLDGRSLRRVTGDRGLPEQLESAQLIGPEIPVGHAATLAPAIPEGAAVLPLALRGRALSVLVFSAPPAGDLEALAARGAAALELAERYTDVLASARRHRACSAAAELQQDLMPPRIARLDGAEVACSILPAYDVGGDWIDHCAMADGGWLGVADAVGKGPQASAISAIALGAYRASRRGGGDLADAAASIHAALRALEVARHLHERRPRQLGRSVLVADLAALRAPGARGVARRARSARARGRRRPRPRARPPRPAERDRPRDDRARRARRPRLRRRARAHGAGR